MEKSVTPRDSPPRTTKLDNNADSSHTSPPPHAHTFGYTGTHVVANLRRGWRPESDGGRHDSPLFSRHRKRPSSSSIDSNRRRESETSTVTVNGEQQETKAQQALPSIKPDVTAALPPALVTAINAEKLSVQPPRTPQGQPTYTTFDDGGLSAAQRVRMELSGSRAGSGSRANSSEDIFVSNSPVFDEKKSGPRSCPSSYKDVGGKRARLSPGKGRQVRSGELIVSKLLPTRDNVNSLLTYLHELQISEASLRKQLMTTKQHTEEELYQSLTKLNELQRTMQKVERDRQIAEQRLEEKEQRIRELAAKLKKAETTQARLSPARGSGSPSHELVEQTASMELQTPSQNAKVPGPPTEESPALILEALHLSTQTSHVAASSLRPPQLQSIKDETAQFAVLSPGSPNRPLWDPWASGGATPMKDLPPVFTIGSTELHPVVTSPASTGEPTTNKVDDFELRSVLMSPRGAQDEDEATESVHPTPQTDEQYVSPGLLIEQEESTLIEPQHHPSPLRRPSPYPQQQGVIPMDAQVGKYGVELQEEISLTDFSPQIDSLLHVGAMPPIHESPLEQQEENVDKLDSAVEEADLKNNGMTPPTPPNFAEPSTTPPPKPMVENTASEVGTLHSESVQVTQSEQAWTDEAENTGISMPSIPLLSPPPPPPSMPDSPAQKESKDKDAEPASLETLLIDFFTEADKKRLKMAKVYGKRYAGREKWLFAELTKRYGADKVAALKARYEDGIATTTTNTSSDRNGKQDDHVTKSPDTISKAGRQGHPRHLHFFHPPTPANSVGLGADIPLVPTPNAPSKENNSPNSQRGQILEGVGAPPSLRGKTSTDRAVRESPHQLHSVSNTTPVADPPPPFPTTQTIDETDSAATANAGPSMTSRPPPLVHQEKPASSFNQPQPPSFQRGMETSNAAPLGLRQRHNASGRSAETQKPSGVRHHAVALEGLLKELYKNHQPDKLKNVPVVAKQYAGKERELVGLLKGKYGALSVKRLEENLEVLERTHRNRGGKSAAKKRGCFMLTVSLMFWLWVLLYFSFGAVFVSFVVLNAWECRALDNDEQELESSEECVPLKKELETFTYERVADYMSQSHPDACFCSEWKARENALFTNLSGDDLLNLVRLVPFSPDLFGSAWIATVKEQVPSQESYDNYAKPVVDLSLDVGSFVWSSVLELTRYDEASEEKSPIVEEDIADIPSLNEESESNAHTDSPDRAADEMEKEMENESFVNEVEAEDKVTDELYAEEVVVPPEEVPVEVDTFKFDDEPQTGDIEIATKEDMPEEDIIPVDKESAAIKEETFPFTSEAEDDVTSESTDVVESDDPPAIEESEDIPLAKEAALDDTNDVEAEPEDANVESADVYNTEVIETLTVDDAVFASVEETESVNANVEPADVDMAEVTETTPKDDSVLAPVTETEFVDSDDDEFSASTKADAVNAMVDVVEEASDATVEDADNTESLDEENAMESDDVVEVEVLQEGVDLSYTETVSDTNQEELTAESIEIFSSALEDELEPVDIEEDASSELSEAEAEKPVESENVAVESPESETDSAEDTVIIPSIADTVVEVKELSSDADVLTEATDGEMERAEEESVRSEELELNVEPDLNEEEPDTVVVSVDVDEAPVVQSENGDEVASTLSEENEVEVENNELDVVVEVEVETTANNDEGEMSASDEDHGDEEVIVELDSELPSSSNDVDVVEPLSEEGSVGVSNEGAEVANDVSNDEEPVAAPVAVVESLSEDADVKSDEEDAEENGSAIPVEVEASVPQLDLEEVVATVADETVVHELEEALENEASEQKEDLEEGLSASAEIESVVVEGDEEDAVPDSFFENDVESVEVVLDEEADGDAEASTFSAVEEEQSASEVGEFSEQGEESVVIEATEASIEADTDAPDATEDGTEEIEDVENAAFAATEDVETLAGDDTESAIVAEEELPDAVDEAFAVPADEEALEAIDEPAAEDVPELEEAPVIEEPIASIESADEHADITDETEPRQATDESSTTASEEEESGGLASAVNEVLARLVEPFEAAKTAAPEVATEEELA